MGPRRSFSRLERTAYHEAGHAVANVLMRIRLSRVSIIPDEESEGHCLRVKPAKGFHPDYETDSRTVAYTEKLILSVLGGPAAEEHLTGRRVRAGANADWHEAVGLASYMCGSNEEVQAYLKWLWLRAKGMMEQPHHWAAVEVLAEELL